MVPSGNMRRRKKGWKIFSPPPQKIIQDLE
jgi:hypothetical protein